MDHVRFRLHYTASLGIAVLLYTFHICAVDKVNIKVCFYCFLRTGLYVSHNQTDQKTAL